jgi:hypothetical protein
MKKISLFFITISSSYFLPLIYSCENQINVKKAKIHVNNEKRGDEREEMPSWSWKVLLKGFNWIGDSWKYGIQEISKDIYCPN